MALLGPPKGPVWASKGPFGGPGGVFANSRRARAHSHRHAHDYSHGHSRDYYHGHKKKHCIVMPMLLVMGMPVATTMGTKNICHRHAHGLYHGHEGKKHICVMPNGIAYCYSQGHARVYVEQLYVTIPDHCQTDCGLQRTTVAPTIKLKRIQWLPLPIPFNDDDVSEND